MAEPRWLHARVFSVHVDCSEIHVASPKHFGLEKKSWAFVIELGCAWSMSWVQLELLPNLNGYPNFGTNGSACLVEVRLYNKNENGNEMTSIPVIWLQKVSFIFRIQEKMRMP